MKSYRYQYCSRECAAAEHGKKITGPKHPHWQGGLLATRGPSWQKSRLDTIERQGYRCLDCGMTNEKHVAKYGWTLTVHHRSPYRLSGDNSPDNLVALCRACHAKEEAALRKRLSPEDIQTMRENTDEMRALGLDKQYDKSRHKNPCPQCGNPKEKKAKLCKSCSNETRRRVR